MSEKYYPDGSTGKYSIEQMTEHVCCFSRGDFEHWIDAIKREAAAEALESLRDDQKDLADRDWRMMDEESNIFHSQVAGIADREARRIREEGKTDA